MSISSFDLVMTVFRQSCVIELAQLSCNSYHICVTLILALICFDRRSDAPERIDDVRAFVLNECSVFFFHFTAALYREGPDSCSQDKQTCRSSIHVRLTLIPQSDLRAATRNYRSFLYVLSNL